MRNRNRPLPASDTRIGTAEAAQTPLPVPDRLSDMSRRTVGEACVAWGILIRGRCAATARMESHDVKRSVEHRGGSLAANPDAVWTVTMDPDNPARNLP